MRCAVLLRRSERSRGRARVCVVTSVTSEVTRFCCDRPRRRPALIAAFNGASGSRQLGAAA